MSRSVAGIAMASHCGAGADNTELSVSLVSSYREQAQGLVEYGLIIALVAVLAIAGLIIFGPAVSSLLSTVGGSV
jgi:Flp pilus assembly pilin Flp